MNARLLHPSRRRLLHWLVRPESESITSHVESCNRCAERLEHLAEDTDARAPDAALSGAIRAAYAPPEDQTERVLERISERERAERELDMFLGLFSVFTEAAELIFPPPRASEPRSRRDQSARPAGPEPEAGAPNETETDS